MTKPWAPDFPSVRGAHGKWSQTRSTFPTQTIRSSLCHQFGRSPRSHPSHHRQRNLGRQLGRYRRLVLPALLITRRRHHASGGVGGTAGEEGGEGTSLRNDLDVSSLGMETPPRRTVRRPFLCAGGALVARGPPELAISSPSEGQTIGAPDMNRNKKRLMTQLIARKAPLKRGPQGRIQGARESLLWRVYTRAVLRLTVRLRLRDLLTAKYANGSPAICRPPL